MQQATGGRQHRNGQVQRPPPGPTLQQGLLSMQQPAEAECAAEADPRRQAGIQRLVGRGDAEPRIPLRMGGQRSSQWQRQQQRANGRRQHPHASITCPLRECTAAKRCAQCQRGDVAEQQHVQEPQVGEREIFR